MDQFDLLEVDREVRSAAEAWRRWRRARSAGVTGHSDPFERWLRVSGRTSYQLLEEVSDRDPLKVPLQRWTYRLAEQRINQHCWSLVEASRRTTTHSLQQPDAGQFTLAQMLARALHEGPRRRAWLQAMAASSEALAASTALLWERRQEVARQMGLSSPNEIELPGSGTIEMAEEWLGLSAELAGETMRRQPEQVISLALGDEAREGWPARLEPRSLVALLGEQWFDRLALDPGRLPPAVAASSFLRALARVGAAWVDATAPAHQPFAIAHDPYGLRRRWLGALFGLLPLNPAFGKRRLGLTSDRLRQHCRVMGRIVLIESRAAALRVLLRGPALQGRSALHAAHQELVERVFGIHPVRDQPGVLWQLHIDDGQRFVGLLRAAGQIEALFDEHDEDWFRNPRALDQLRSEAALSPATTASDTELHAGGAALLRCLIQTVG